MNLTIGELLDKKYRIVRLLGEGGMGAVYEGQNVRIHHRVAIKVLHEGVASSSDIVQRFEREAQAAGQIGSEHIVEVYDLGELPGGARYMVMEYLDGENLSKRLERFGRMPPDSLVPIMLQLLEGLGAAHRARIVHRDLKPDNIFLQRNKNGQDFVKIVDFGVSKFNVLGSESQMRMTRTGSVFGTPYYMSPEQAKGEKSSDHRSDVYSAGVVLYECTTGQVPFHGETFNELMFKIALEQPPDPEMLVLGLDPRFAAIIRTAMAREPAKRYQSASEFAQAILQWTRAAGMQSFPDASLRMVAAPVVDGATLSVQPLVDPAVAAHRAALQGTPATANVSVQRVAPTPAGATNAPSTATPPGPANEGSPANAGSLNVVAVGSVAIEKRSSAGLVALIAAAVMLVAGGGLIVGIKLKKATPPVAVDTAATHAPPPAATDATSATAAPVAATSASVVSPVPTSTGSASASVASAAPTVTGAAESGVSAPVTRRSHGSHAADGAAPGGAAGSMSTMEVKGRTVHTDL
jgi:serine/threonine-protein kinase